MTLKLAIPEKLMPFLTKKKRYKVAIGGRGGGKSYNIGDLLNYFVATEGDKVGCLREYQNSLDDSVFSLLSDRINEVGIPGFHILKNRIDHSNDGGFRFKGLARSIDAIKSLHGFKKFWLEEGQFISKGSLKILTPTLREEGSELWISANPMSQFDAFSQRFIEPFKYHLDKNGFYEDDLHYIVKVNYYDNPFFPEVLELERQNDYKTLSREEYNHIWLGDYNDTIDNAIIKAEWFDACIDAHKKLGFKPLGIRAAAYDPSDVGEDPGAYAFRHGSVLLNLQSFTEGDSNESCDWATGLAIEDMIDQFTWDCDGLGAALNRQVNAAFDGKPHIRVSQFKGSTKVDFPKAIFKNVNKQFMDITISEQKTNEEALKNKRAQYYEKLQARVYNTYRAVEHGEYIDPDEMISFSSELELLQNLRSELCKIPKKPNANGFFELYTKKEMKSKFRIPSPNLADVCMMFMRVMPQIVMASLVRRPPVQKVIHLGRNLARAYI